MTIIYYLVSQGLKPFQCWSGYMIKTIVLPNLNQHPNKYRGYFKEDLLMTMPLFALVFVSFNIYCKNVNNPRPAAATTMPNSRACVRQMWDCGSPDIEISYYSCNIHFCSIQPGNQIIFWLTPCENFTKISANSRHAVMCFSLRKKLFTAMANKL